MLQVFSSLATGIGTSETGNTGVLKREKFMNCKKKKKKKSGLIERVSYIGLSGCGVINTLQSFFSFLFHYREDVWQQFVARSHTNCTVSL